MVGELIMLPLRVGIRATRLWFRVAEETANVAASASGRLIGLAASRGSDGDGTGASAVAGSERARGSEVQSRRPGGSEVHSRQQRPRGSGAENRQPASSATAPPPVPPASATASERPLEPLRPEPSHVSEEPALVEELAEPGAEEGAGAEVRVEEPWEGYAHTNAKEVVARLSSATPAELAAVQLYESRHRRRQTILAAVQRELRSRNGSGSPNQ